MVLLLYLDCHLGRLDDAPRHFIQRYPMRQPRRRAQNHLFTPRPIRRRVLVEAGRRADDLALERPVVGLLLLLLNIGFWRVVVLDSRLQFEFVDLASKEARPTFPGALVDPGVVAVEVAGGRVVTAGLEAEDAADEGLEGGCAGGDDAEVELKAEGRLAFELGDSDGRGSETYNPQY